MISTNIPLIIFFLMCFPEITERPTGVFGGSVLRDLTGHVNEAHIHIYFGIYLFRVECSGCMILAERAMEKTQRNGWGGGIGAASEALVKQLPFHGHGILCPPVVKLTREENKNNQKAKSSKYRPHPVAKIYPKKEPHPPECFRLLPGG